MMMKKIAAAALTSLLISGAAFAQTGGGAGSGAAGSGSGASSGSTSGDSPATSRPQGTAPGAAGGSGSMQGAVRPPTTETEAASHFAKAGFPNVTNLTRNADGTWQGMATRNGTRVRIAMDARGQVNVMN